MKLTNKQLLTEWENIRLEDNKLLAQSNLSESYPFAQKLAGLVDDGVLKMVSVGAAPLELSDDPKLKLPGQELPTVTKWVLKEISLVDIGAHNNSIVLYDSPESTTPLDLTDPSVWVTLSEKTGKVPIDKLKPDSTKMSELKNIALALGKQEDAEESILLAEIKTMKAAKTTAELRLEALEEKEKERTKKDVEILLADAIKEKKITEADKARWVKLFELDHDTAKDTLAAIQPQIRLSDIPKGDEGKNNGEMKFNGKTWDELEKADQLITLKDGNFDLFKQMYKAKFGKDYKV